MPPTRPIAPPLPAVPTPEIQTPATLNPDSLSGSEELLLGVAIRINSAVREFQKKGGKVNISFFRKSLDEELLEASTIFNNSPADRDDPRLHPIITYVGEMSEEAEARGSPLDLGAIKLSEVARRCGLAAAASSTWPQELFTPDLTVLLRRVPMEYRWWLPPLPRDIPAADDDIDMAAVPAAVTETAPVPPIAPSTPEPSTPDRNVEMSPDDGGDTPRRQTRAGKRSAAARPSLDEQEAQRLCLDDPTACGPCRENRRECKVLRGKGTACTSCAALKIRCDRPTRSGSASSAPKARTKRRTALEAVEDQKETLEALQNDNAELREVMYTMEQMLRDLCIKANIPPPPPVQRRIPQAPLSMRALQRIPPQHPSKAPPHPPRPASTSTCSLLTVPLHQPECSQLLDRQDSVRSRCSMQLPERRSAAGLGRGVEEQQRLLQGLLVRLQHAGVLAHAPEGIIIYARRTLKYESHFHDDVSMSALVGCLQALAGHDMWCKGFTFQKIRIGPDQSVIMCWSFPHVCTRTHITPLTPSHKHIYLNMESDTSVPQEPSAMKGRDTSIERVFPMLTSLSDPEDIDQSDMQSFDEDDMYGSDNSDDVIVVHLESDPDSEPDAQTLIAQMYDDVIQGTRQLRRDVEILSAMAKALCEAPIAHIFSGTNSIQEDNSEAN
ncbi:hypothetical protein EI94DRAFT_1704813 [Lactarius quietus]|nr:hypothetical protein EI94DRAFT_1704813 [Lactarius quietus]